MLCQSLNHQTGVDNLPGEVCHLIKKVEQLVSWSIHSWLHLNAFLKLYESELQQEIDKDSAKYIRHLCHIRKMSKNLMGFAGLFFT